MCLLFVFFWFLLLSFLLFAVCNAIFSSQAVDTHDRYRPHLDESQRRTHRTGLYDPFDTWIIRRAGEKGMRLKEDGNGGKGFESGNVEPLGGRECFVPGWAGLGGLGNLVSI
jgi:hypothetical protein